MPFHPIADAVDQAGRDISVQSDFSALETYVPCDIAADKATGDGAQGQNPWIAAVSHKPEEQ
jgi:hypothetical protein